MSALRQSGSGLVETSLSESRASRSREPSAYCQDHSPLDFFLLPRLRLWPAAVLREGALGRPGNGPATRAGSLVRAGSGMISLHARKKGLDKDVVHGASSTIVEPVRETPRKLKATDDSEALFG
jgi:hypothetical protein